VTLLQIAPASEDRLALHLGDDNTEFYALLSVAGGHATKLLHQPAGKIVVRRAEAWAALLAVAKTLNPRAPLAPAAEVFQRVRRALKRGCREKLGEAYQHAPTGALGAWVQTQTWSAR